MSAALRKWKCPRCKRRMSPWKAIAHWFTCRYAGEVAPP